MSDLERTKSSPPSLPSTLVMKALSKRRTWAILFLAVYAVLLSSSWNLLLSIHSWYNHSTTNTASTLVYASLLYGAVFGLLSMGAALAVAVPATLVTWITVLVLLAFAGRPRTALVMEGRKVTADIVGVAFRVLIREGNFVAVLSAALSCVALLMRRRCQQQLITDDDDGL